MITEIIAHLKSYVKNTMAYFKIHKQTASHPSVFIFCEILGSEISKSWIFIVIKTTESNTKSCGIIAEQTMSAYSNTKQNVFHEWL